MMADDYVTSVSFRLMDEEAEGVRHNVYEA
jgi:hypothetical protein